MSVRRLKWCFYTALVLLLVVTTTSCTSSDYQKYTLREGITHFSFEYPKSYEETLVSTQFGNVHVVFSRLLPDYNYTDSLFSVIVYSSGIFDRSDDANATLEKIISMLGDLYEDFQVLERSEVHIDSVVAELLVCSYTIVEVPDDESIWKPSPSFVLDREVFFDHNGLIWNISIISDETRIEADEAIWEHLLETFKILD